MTYDGGGLPEPTRDSVLEAGIAKYVAERGGRVAYRGTDRTVVVTGRPVNHILHLLLTIVTGGLWLIAWVLIAATGGEKTTTLTVAPDGRLLADTGRVRADGQVRWIRLGAAIAILAGLLLWPAGLPWWAAVPLVVLGVGAFVYDVRAHGVAKNEARQKAVDL